ncbi:MAG: glycosyltransferase family 4 protein [Geminicoccales bacterium]
MKIACVQTFPVDYCIDYVNAITSLGEVVFLAADRQMRHYIDFVDPAVETVLLPWPRHRSPGNLRLIYRLRQEIRARDPDVIHFLGDGVSWLSLMPSLVGRRPVLVTVHDVMRHPGDTKSSMMPYAVTNLFHRQANRLVVHGESIRTLLAQRAKRPLDQIDIIPHPALRRYAEIARRQSLPPRSSDHRFRILFFGRIMTYKGLPHLLDAMELLGADEHAYELVVAGKGPGLDDVADRLRAPYICLHPGFIPDIDAARMFQETDLVVLPYVEASQSGILAMAAAFGRAVLVTDVGELGEIVRTTEMGLIVPPGDASALADAIRRVKENAMLKAELETKSAEAAETGALSPPVVASLAQNAYRRAIAGGSSLKRAQTA